jgi:fatty-acyl-CoA synthase
MTLSKQALVAGELNVWALLQSVARRQPRQTALQQDELRVSYAEFVQRALVWAARLAAQGVGHGDRVAILSENRVEYLEILFGCARLGAIAACQNWRLSREELAHCLRLIEPRVLVASRRFLEAARLAAGDGDKLLPMEEAWNKGPREIAADPSALAPASSGGEEGLYILYTSGTTGFPKGALISHRALIARSLVHALDRPVKPTSAFVAWSPLFHMGAMDAALAALIRGGKVIVMDGFHPEALAQVVAREEIGHLTIVPGVVERFLQAMKDAGVSPKGVGVVGVMADLVPPRLIAELTRVLDAPYSNTFGSTETGSPPASRGLVPVGQMPTELPKLQSSLCEVRLVDEKDHDVADGEPGELALRSPTLFSGYWGAPDENAEVFRNGWYHMGDVFKRRPTGELEYVDRKKYLIKSGGENIYPAELERVLLAMPGIEEAVVIRQKDDAWGEVPVAVVVRAQGADLAADAVTGFCRGRIASYKLPRRVVFAQASQIPRNVSGKVERLKLEGLVATAGEAS